MGYRTWVPGALAALLLTSACGGDGNGAAETTSPAPATTTTAPAPPVTTAPKPGMSADEIAVRNLIDLEAAEFAAALDPPDPNRPGLLALNTGAAQQKTIEIVSELQNKGEYARREQAGPVPHKTDSVDFKAPDTAVVHECLIDDRVTHKLGSNEVTDDVVSSARFETTVVRGADGQWRISSRKTIESYPTRNACPHVG